MRSHVLLSLVIILFIAACVTPQQQTSPVPSPSPSAPSEAQPVQTKEPIAPIAAPIVELPEKLTTLLAKRSGITSMKYSYKSGTNSVRVLVRGTNMKIMLVSPMKTSDGTFVSSIYLDTNQRTAIGVCDDPVPCKNYPNAKSPVSFDAFVQKTPTDWANELEQKKYVPLTQAPNDVNVEDRTTYIFTYDDNAGTQTRFFIDAFFGVPIQIQTITGESTTGTLYSGIGFNTVKASDVAVPN